MSDVIQTAKEPASGLRSLSREHAADSGTDEHEYVRDASWTTTSLPDLDPSAMQQEQPPERPTFKNLYPIPEAMSPQLRAVHEHMNTTIDRVSEAIAAAEANDMIASDDHVMHAMMHLRELFCLREIGDGFGAVINAALASLMNLRGVPATVHQLTVLRRRLEILHLQPFLTIDQAVEEIEKLEASGLDCEPPGFRVIASWLDDDSIR